MPLRKLQTMPRFLLVAPLVHTSAHDPIDERTSAQVSSLLSIGHGASDAGSDADTMRMRSRLSYTPQYLTQRWYDIVPPSDGEAGAVSAESAPHLTSRLVSPTPDDSTRGSDVRIERAAIAVSRTTTVLVVDAYIGESWDAAEAVESDSHIYDSIDRLEKALSECAEELVRDIRAGLTSIPGAPATSAIWVARYLRVSQSDSLPEGWLGGDTEPVPIGSPPDSAALQIGWGNGVLRGVEDLGPLEWDEMVRGLVDAQTIWSELAMLSDVSGHTLNELYGPDDRDSKRRRRRLMGQVENFAGALATHQLAYDDLTLTIQGIRRRTAVATLESWEYADALGRVDRRLSDTLVVANTMRSVNERKYQELVQGVLYGLAVLTVLDVSLALIGTAFSGSDEEPGQDSPLRILEAIRLTNQDSLIVAALVIAVAAAAAYLIGRRT